ncbi:DedA family protein [Rhodococcus sp. NPDC003318]|uniref:DedA family protein n=1 Tax=Rhodococcus sp. NPDC003318 TaxID=3364503 RepID=UPI003694534B
MTTLLERLQGLEPLVVYLVVSAFVFVEDALFIGFVVPGETAAIVGGVIASQADVNLWVMVAVVIVAAMLGDTVGFGIGRRVGPRILRFPFLSNGRLDGAQDMLRRRGGPAVFFGRFVAFIRTVMPALAGISGMPYTRFLAFNAVAAIIFGTGNVLLGFFAGNSYERVESALGSGAWLLVAVAAVLALGWWLRRRFRRTSSGSTPLAEPDDSAAPMPVAGP